MNYWILTTEFPPFHGGGISTYNLHTSLMLKEKGHEVTVFVSDHHIEKEIERTEYRQISIIRFKPGHHPCYEYLGYTAALSLQFAEIVLKEILTVGSPDFIETQDYHGIGYYLILKKKLGEQLLSTVPIVLTAHAPSFYYLKNSQAPVYKLPDYWTGEMEKWTLKAADILISPSQYLIDNIKPELEEAFEQYHVVRNPYKCLSENTIVSPSITKGDIVFFGKLTYQKGPIQLLKNMSELWDQGFEFNLSFIGGDHFFEPKQMNMQEYLITRFNNYYKEGRVRFEGKIVPEQLANRLAKAHLIIIPSVVDNFPYAVVEAMAEGKVLLVSDSGGQKELIEDGISGYIYKQGDFNSFKEKITLIVECTETKYQEISKNAKHRVTEICNYEVIYKQKISILNTYKGVPENKDFPMIRNIPRASSATNSPVASGVLSIVVPYYNTGKYIRETVESIYKVNYPNKEVIVVNDGSNDPDSIAILINLQSKYQFKIIDQRNLGLAEARNTGIKNATGEFIAFLDADDKIHPDFYMRGIEILRAYKNLSFVSSWVQYFDASTGIWPSQNPEPPFLFLHNMVNAGFVCRRQDYLNFAFNDSNYEYGMEDYDVNISLLKNGCRGVVIPEPLYYYRIHSQSMARGFNKNNQLYLYRILSEKHSSFYSQYAYEIFNLLLANGPSYLYDNPTKHPSTDVIELRNRVMELENAIGWYDRTLKHYQSSENFNDPVIVPEKSFSIENFNSQYLEVKNWYHKEYEVLPLWYKRFGHIIKVFQGNRSLKSLIKNK